MDLTDLETSLSNMFFIQETKISDPVENIIEKETVRNEYGEIQYQGDISGKIIKAKMFEKYHYHHESDYILNADIDLPIFNFFTIKTPKKFINRIINDISLGFDNRLIASLNIYKMALISTRGPYEYENGFITSFYDTLFSAFKKLGMNNIESLIVIDEFLLTLDKIILSRGNYLKANYGEMEKYNYSCAVSYYFSTKVLLFDFTDFQHKSCLQELSMRGIGEIIYSRIKDSKEGKNGLKYIHVPEFENGVDGSRGAWAFYYKTHCNEKFRYWSLDYKFNKLINTLIDNIENYCGNVFNKKYIALYGDRKKRDLFSISNDNETPNGNFNGNRAIIQDLRQLLKNIRILSNKKSLFLEIKNRLREKIKYAPNENDIFDSKYIDYTIEQEFSEITNISEIQENKVKLLFYKNE